MRIILYKKSCIVNDLIMRKRRAELQLTNTIVALKIIRVQPVYR
jgi:hypothetical protein